MKVNFTSFRVPVGNYFMCRGVYYVIADLNKICFKGGSNIIIDGKRLQKEEEHLQETREGEFRF